MRFINVDLVNELKKSFKKGYLRVETSVKIYFKSALQTMLQK